MQVLVDIPEKYLIDYDSTEMSSLLRLNTALLQFQEGKISLGAACEFAGVDRFTFMKECKKHKIPVINYTPEELEEEFKEIKKEK